MNSMEVGNEASLGIDASADGKRNAYHIRCNVVGHCRPYAACLNLCASRKEGRLDVMYAECSAAIGKKECPALAMRKEEVKAGKAIYFEERKLSVIESFVHKARKWVVGVTSKPEPSESKPRRKSVVIDSGSYADAINIATSEKELKPVTKAVATAPAIPSVKIEAKPGESLIEMARRLAAQAKQ